MKAGKWTDAEHEIYRSYLYNADDARFLQKLLHDAGRWQTLSRSARQRAETFSWQRTAAEMEAVCAALAAQPARAQHG